MKWIWLALLSACAELPPERPEQPCLSVSEIQTRNEKVKELTKLMADDTELLDELRGETKQIAAKFARLNRAFEHSSVQSLAKLQQRRAELTAMAQENEARGKEIQLRLQKLQVQLDVELAALDEHRPACAPKN